MGRNKVHHTEEARHNAEKQRKRNWYHRNSELIKKINLEYYYKHKYEKDNG
jgi:hypothetical protein